MTPSCTIAGNVEPSGLLRCTRRNDNSHCRQVNLVEGKILKKLLSLFAFALTVAAGTHAAQAQASPSPAPSEMASPMMSPGPMMNPAGAASPSPSPSPAPSPPPHLIQLSGFLDAAYSSHIGPSLTNFSAPNAFGVPVQPGYPSRVFDYNDKTIDLQNANIQAALNAGNLTGKLELSAGSDADIIQSWPAAFNGFDVTQAYLAYQLGKLSLQGGKFETLAGAEVIENPSNLNISRSILFGFAVPFTHTGGRLTYAVTPHLNVIGGVNAGWDEVRSTNGRLTAEYGFAFNPSPAVSLTAQGYTGFEQIANYTVGYNPYAANYNSFTTLNGTQVAELAPNSQPSGAQGQRSLIDVVGTVHPTSATTLTFNYDHGLQHNYNIGDPFLPLTASWSGLAGYASYALTPKITVSGRYEGFQDPQGYRTGFQGMLWHEGTATVAYSLTSALTLRGEYRHDTANQPVFLSSDNSTLNNAASTFALEGLVKF
jgi:hypothetical protein